MVSARRDQIEPKAQAGSGAARWALKGIEHVSVSLAATQLGITACSLVIGAVGEPALASLLVIPLHAVGLPTELSHVIALVVALLIVTFLHMVFGEMVPKNIAIAAPSRTAILLGPVLHVFVVLFRPLIWVMNHLSNLVVKHVLRTEPADEVQSTFNSEEVSAFVAESTKEGLIDRDEGGQLLHAAVKFEERTASDAAVPRRGPGGGALDGHDREVEQLCAKTGYSRFPRARRRRDLVGLPPRQGRGPAGARRDHPGDPDPAAGHGCAGPAAARGGPRDAGRQHAHVCHRYRR